MQRRRLDPGVRELRSGRRGSSGTSGLCIRSLLHPGQPQLNGEARRLPLGYGKVVGIFTLFDGGSVVQVVSLVRASLEYLAMDTFSCVSAPGRLAAEGRWQWRSSPVAFLMPHAGGSHFRCPCTPVQLRSSELPATNVGESSRGGSLRRHKAGPVTAHFVFKLLPQRAGFFLRVLFKPCVDRDERVCKRRALHRCFSEREDRSLWGHPRMRCLRARHQSVSTVSLGSAHSTQVSDGQPPWATVLKNGGRPSQKLAGTNPTTGRQAYVLT